MGGSSDTEFILPKVQVCYTSRSSSTEKPPLHFELPPISYVQEMGGNSYAGDYDSAAC